MTFEIGIRNAEIIDRWGIMPCRNRGSMGAHSHRVAIYADQICGLISGLTLPAFRYNVMRWALWHDMPEIITGDIQGPCKEHMDRGRLKKYEADFMSHMFPGMAIDVHPDDTAMIIAIVKVADMLDECLWIVGEEKMGNQHLADVWFGSHAALCKAVEALPCDEASRQAVDLAIRKAVYAHRNRPWALTSRGK